MADARFENLVEHARAEMARWRVPGLTLGVLDAYGAVEVAGLGATSLETGWPVSPDTLFQIGSISKVFCATLVMTLVDEGRVDLDAPIRAYLPDLALADPAAPGAITVRHLLTHQSGVWGDFFDDFGWGDDALATALAHMRALEQLYPPGELWSYCNAGFQLAGAIAERVLGQPFEAAMRERVLAPLGLERTVSFPHEAFAYPHAVGHTERTPGALDFQVARDYWLHRAINPAGGLLSTARDLIRFAAFHLGDGTSNGARVLSEAALRAMREPQTAAANWADAWGLGWDLRTIGGLQVIGHGGGTNGFITRLTVVPERRVALAVLTNASSGGAVNRAVERAALERYCGIRVPEPEIVSLPPERLARVAGVYRTPHGTTRVGVEDGGLRLEQVSRDPASGEEVTYPPVRYRPLGELEFVAVEGEGEGERIDFIPGDGGIRFLRLHGRLARPVAEP